MMEVEAANWKGKMGTAIKTHDTLQKFFTELAYLMCKENYLRLFFLKVNGEPIATQYAIEHSNRLWILKIGYDERWGNFSPGTLLMDRVVKYCFDQKLEACEFLGNNDDWLHDWATGVHELVSYKIYPKTVTGILTEYQDQLAESYHNVFNHLKYKWVFRKGG
ncbi:MAG: GNAT family N-acetyltransferase [Aliifodinibius sp.]|nr:GNAT family N-acetyltransferase [Fodinibius sp.]